MPPELVGKVRLRMASDDSPGTPARKRVGRTPGVACHSSTTTQAPEEVVSTLAAQRRYLAEELETVCGLRTSALVEAFAAVPREDFLPRGPWMIRSETDYLSGVARRTPDDDLAMCIDRLALSPGQRVLHIGCGLGYYSALIARCVGLAGHVVAVEDPHDESGDSGFTDRGSACLRNTLSVCVALCPARSRAVS
jgi:hypothetical protein